MLPGPPQVGACPHDNALAQYMTLLSGDTLGATTWTDGCRVAPMLPESPPVVRCSKCRRFYWLAKARKIGEVREIYELSFDECLAALESWLATDQDEEKHLRVLGWWRYNDEFRGDSGRPARPERGRCVDAIEARRRRRSAEET